MSRQPSTILTGLRAVVNAVKMKSAARLPKDFKIVKTGQCLIGEIGKDQLAVRDIHYCLAVLVRPKNREGFYILAHFEGCENLQKEITEIGLAIDKIAMPKEQLEAIIYGRLSGGGSEAGDKCYDRNRNNFGTAGKFLVKYGVDAKVETGAQKAVFVGEDGKLEFADLKFYLGQASTLEL